MGRLQVSAHQKQPRKHKDVKGAKNAARFSGAKTTAHKDHELELMQRALKNMEEKNAKLKEELKISQDKLIEASRYDHLTRLPNQVQFDEDLKREIARAVRFERHMALLYVDVDNFKKINENFGRDVGDNLLQQFADRLRHCIRTEDCIARMGNDEFAVLLTEVNNPHEAGLVAHRIVEVMSKPYRIDTHEIMTGASIGIAYFPEAGEDTTTLHRNAMIALNSVRICGRNHYQFFTSSLQEQNSQRLVIESELHFALERQEFFLLYQPRIDLESGEMTGMEVLIRWNHPERGVMEPAEFLQAAEETGLIVPIGLWVLHTACQEYMNWYKDNNSFDCSLTVNISPRQLQYRRFMENVSNILKETGMPSDKLELEVTETAMVGYLGRIEDTLFQLRHIGVRISVDHFGTGFSNLSRLKELPIEAIKIDRSIINDIDVKVSENLIIRSTINMGKDLGVNVVAGGVENTKQVQYLIKSRCPEAQGYFYCKPMSADMMTDYIRTSHTAVTKK